MILFALLLTLSLAPSALLEIREWSRRSTCSQHMRGLTAGLLAFEQAHQQFPAAAHWDTATLHALELHTSRHWHQFVRQNWALELLPHLGHEQLAQRGDPDAAICAGSNTALRTTVVPDFVCPSDTFNRVDNPYQLTLGANPPIEFARGNYALNAGTNSYLVTPGSTTTPTGDHAELEIDYETRTFRLWGNGIGGINRGYSRAEFSNGSATLVAFNELRAGIDPLDLRGTWALGQIAASLTWGHGLNGDACGPNNPWARSDDIENCAALNDKYSPQGLVDMGMPCVSYIDANQNAASRSQHPGGVNTAFLDVSVRFVSNEIDPSLWHVMHSRETPVSVLEGQPQRLDGWPGSTSEAAAPPSGHDVAAPPQLTNSIGMEFVRVAAGNFRMGVADRGMGDDLPPETPAHPVTLTHDYYLGRCEITREQYQHVMETSDPGIPTDQRQHPVTGVSWHDAVEFCRKLSARPEEQDAGRAYRLPTEAEWEFACRERTSNQAVWRSQRRPDDDSGTAAGQQPELPLTPVGSYPPNSLGLHDMRGNAWEWCADWFDRDYYARSREVDPAGPVEGYAKVVRGADWIYRGEACFINYPILPPWQSSPVIGFRVVCIATSAARAGVSGSPDRLEAASP